MKQSKYKLNPKKKSYANLIIVLIGILVIMLTGFAYAARLQDIEDFASSWFSNNQSYLTSMFS